MDIAYRLILYILMANVGYMVFSLALKGIRGYTGYILQLLCLLCLMVLMMSHEVEGITAIVVSLSGIGILVFLPMYLQRQIDILISENRLNELEGPARWKAAIAWSEMNNHILWLSKVANKYAEDEILLKQSLRESLVRGEPYDSMTRSFLGVIHFNTRDFSSIIADLRLQNCELTSQSFEELLYLVRAYLETTQYEEAIEAQIALEKVALASGATGEKVANLMVSRMLLFAFTGWRNELESLMEYDESGIAALPSYLREFWRGVGIFNSGDFSSGEAAMAKVISEASADEENESWLPFMRKRFYSLLDNKEFFERKLLGKLQEIREKYSERLERSFAELINDVEEEPASQFATSSLLWITAAVSVFVMFSGNIEDIFNLIRYGANSSFLVRNGETFRLFTYQFIHIGWIHLMMNLLALKIFGPRVEMTLGSPLFIALYFISGVAGGGAAVYYGQPLSAGASAAVLGLLSASIVFELFVPGTRQNANFSTLIFILIINLIIGAVEKGVDNSAHMGGLAAGAICAIVFLPILKSIFWKRIIGNLFAGGCIILCLWSFISLYSEYPIAGLPYNVGEFKHHSFGSASETVELPVSWVINHFDSDKKMFDAVGPFRERLTVIGAPNDSGVEEVLNEYISLRTSEIEKNQEIHLKSRRGPEKIELRGDTYKIRWALETAGGPVSVVDYMVFAGPDFYLVRFFLGTEFDSFYDAIMNRAVMSVN